jgi:hypothetical protein
VIPVLTLHQPWGDEVVPLPLGAIVATCTLVDVAPVESIAWHPYDGPDGARWWGSEWQPGVVCVNDGQRPYGDFAPGRFAWLLEDVKPLDEPVPFKGGQGLTRTWEAA